MTAARTTANIILGTGDDAITVYSTNVEKIYNKALVIITPSQSTANSDLGPKETLIVDTQRNKILFNVDGFINSTDQTALENLFDGGGVFNMTWKGANYNINLEKLLINEFDGTEQDEIKIKFAGITGKDIG